MPEDASTSLLLLIPEEVHEVVVNGGAEIVEERRVGQKRPRRFVRIFDEYEWEELLRSAPPRDSMRPIYEFRWKELQWARATLWADERMQRFVGSPDPQLWPSVEHIAATVMLVCQLKEFVDIPPDRDGAGSLARAVHILRRDLAYAGLHPLRTAPVAGKLSAYEVLERVPAVDHNVSLATAGRALPATMAATALLDLEPEGVTLELSKLSFSVGEVLRLSFPQRALDELVLHLDVAGPDTLSLSTSASTESKFRRCIEAHRKHMGENMIGLFGDVMDAADAFGVQERVLAEWMHSASDAHRKVRLRGGVYATVIHRTEVFVVFRTHSLRVQMPPQARLSEEEQEAFFRAFRVPFSDCESIGRIRWMPCDALPAGRPEMERVLRSTFLSPVLDSAPFADVCDMEDPIELSVAVQVVRAKATINPFVILHGSRVDRGFQGDTAFLNTLKQRRDRLAEEQTEMALRDAQTQSSRADEQPILPSDGCGNSTIVSTTYTGEDLRASMERAVVTALSSGPLTKTDLSRHQELQAWVSLPNFDALLKAALKSVAVYKGRRYVLQ